MEMKTTTYVEGYGLLTSMKRLDGMVWMACSHENIVIQNGMGMEIHRGKVKRTGSKIQVQVQVQAFVAENWVAVKRLEPVQTFLHRPPKQDEPLRTFLNLFPGLAWFWPGLSPRSVPGCMSGRLGCSLPGPTAHWIHTTGWLFYDTHRHVELVRLANQTQLNRLEELNRPNR